MQILRDLLVKGRAYLDGLLSFGSGTITVLVLDGTEVKKKIVGTIVLKNDNEYLSSIVTSVPAHLQVTASPLAPSTNNLTITLKSQAKNLVFAAPTNLTGTPAFRPLVEEDIPNISISKVVNLQDTLSNLTPPMYYLEDSTDFDANKWISQLTPRYINLGNHLDMQDTGAYTFEVDILFHCHQRSYSGGAYRHFNVVAKRKYEITVITDMTSGRTRRVTHLKTISHSGRWLQYNVSGTAGSSVIKNGQIDEKHITGRAFISDGTTPSGIPTNNPVIELSHSLNEHPEFWADITYRMYGKYTVKHNFLKTLQTS